MKLNKFIVKSAAVALIIGTSLPLAAAAQSDNSAREPRQARGQRGICAALDNGAGAKMSEKRQQHEASMAEKRAEREAKLEGKRQARDEKRAEKREAADERIAKIEAKLAELATDDEQKEAITIFQAAVQTAVQARRDAFSAANEVFRSGLDQSVSDRQVEFDVIVETYKLAVSAAEDQAKTDCAVEDADQAQIRSALMAAVKAARDEMRAANQSIGRVGEAAKALQEARKEAIEQAKEDFHAAMEQAKADLKAVLGEAKADDEDEEGEEDEE